METRKVKNAHHDTTQCYSRLNAIGDALYVLGGKWKLRIIMALSEGNLRFNELQRLVKGISPRVLSNELKELEINGFVKRHIHTEGTVLVEYELTEYSDTLGDVLYALSEWGMMHRENIRKQMRSEEVALAGE
ncbi:helix-turn-helix domain-containing protein [Cytophagaceae bacterium DM2B3-1]|uniref:Helix-turn-helix domain-containing protein n=1 Tax=Xanthocytophaga flava TaxID=3048013 RepID=A0ABT7D194_9BACT|nr:helix-turn-helix domain-containing protein [Xanthocytophaga flavus]MDJ1472882.1 helix-turn-helix domain-containing protein [Xanthocytophaga flavus]MDJ1498564.1 helix-turn-helix domain-containing protein [Xanthocytophaga flavus]